ncbi:MAG: type II secretion system F family protein [Oligoflexales bacterium]|nr:type II secretion system F family protein [Oligoflexales bacterium]
MPIYLYKGYDTSSGAARKGKVEAESIKAARQKLKTKEKVIASELKEEVSLAKGQTKGFNFFQPKVKLADMAVMTKQFATLQQASVPLDESLKALTEQVETPVLRNTLSALKDAVSEGKSLGDAMSAFPNTFNRLYVNMVKAGESSGSLGLVLQRLADFQEYQVAVQGQVFGALAYPIIMILASVGIIAYIFISVVPKLQRVFTSMKVTLPWYTKSLIDFSSLLQNRWYLFIAAAMAVYFIFRAWYNSESGRMIFDRYSLKVPIFGPIVLRLNVSKFTKTLSTLLSSGVPIITALEITKNIINNKPIADAIGQAKLSVQEGESLGVTIEKSKLFPPLVTHMIKTGEKTGELEQMLQHVAVAYDAEVERKIETMISLIEPLMIMVMGGIVVVVVVAMLVPMLSIMGQMR